LLVVLLVTTPVMAPAAKAAVELIVARKARERRVFRNAGTAKDNAGSRE